MNQNDNRPVEVLQEWRDENGRVDLAAVRSGMVDIRHSDAVFAALLDETEQARAERELLRAVLTAIDLPKADAHIDWRRARRELLERRTSDVRIGLSGYLDGSAPIETTLSWVRDTVNDYPVAYKVEGGES